MREASEIVNFFTDKVVFLTGGTGFLGKVTLERLLRVCRVKTVYILVRQKKGKSEAERFDEIFGQVLYDRLKKECPDYRQHVAMITGNCSDENLNISEENWNILHSEVEVVLHCAATVRFDQSFRTAYYINVRATKDLIENAKKMTKLKCFIHVSTAFSNCHEKTIEEKIYQPPMTEEQLNTMLQTFPDDKFIKAMEPSLLGEFPNTYTYTKCVAEELVSRMAKDPGNPLPIAIVRPSMILSSYKEPMPGWIDNVYGPPGATVSCGVGLLRTLHCDLVKKADIVPVDFVVNALLAVAYYTSQNERSTDAFDVYNFTSWKHSIDWSTYMDLCSKEGRNYPLMSAIWRPFFLPTRYLFLYNLYWFFLHTIPAYIVDGILKIIGKPPLLVAGYKKIRKFTEVISFFTVREWQMPHRKIVALFEKMNKADQELFELRMSTFNWEEYAKDYVLGGRIYILKEPVTKAEDANRHHRKLFVAHYTLVCFLIFIGVYMLNLFLSLFGYNFF